jgi:hypothetical protein
MGRWLPMGAMLVLCGCATANYSSSRTFTPVQINENASAFDGRTVRIRGFVTIGAENRTFHQSKAVLNAMQKDWGKPNVDPNAYDKTCLTLINALDRDLNLPAYNHRTVELIARVDKDYGAEVIDLGACGIDTGIEVLRVVKVTDYRPLSTQIGL